MYAIVAPVGFAFNELQLALDASTTLPCGVRADGVVGPAALPPAQVAAVAAAAAVSAASPASPSFLLLPISTLLVSPNEMQTRSAKPSYNPSANSKSTGVRRSDALDQALHRREPPQSEALLVETLDGRLERVRSARELVRHLRLREDS